MNYANKRVKILSKEHLDHVIKVTGMEVKSLGMKKLLGRNLTICFGDDFNNNKNDWCHDHADLYPDTIELEEIFIPLPDPQRVINDIKGRLDLDHLTDDELVEHLCGAYGKEWNGVEPLRVGHVVKYNKHTVTISLVDERYIAVLIEGVIWTIHIDNLKPVKSKAEMLVDALVNRMINHYGNPKGAEQYKGLAEAIVNDEDIKRLQS